MNTANKLTMIRVMLIPVFVVLLYINFWFNCFINNISVAIVVFIIAGLTDIADGAVARKRNQITDFGKFMDPLADKVLTFAAMFWLIEAGLMPAWLVLIVIVREFMVTGMRLVAAAKDRVVAASIWGKIKTLVTVICIVAMLLAHIVFESESALLLATLIVCWSLIGVTTIISGAEYFIKNKDIMKLDR
ncbi:MAG: CDP-diacylglycerol--glycerol-3-phosphate 3-phosphatidyltransferase [Oscillospiraceae bacterium]|jgi:CDP-diacylglycerol--glycerol-3-phosphate 3-phosphatidyltransferase|nr:CDP-diacylglycerol--glycerol-3-phosphate 3-phosphatidyltransferase [Oscillospiraceae bacterium]